MSENVFILGAGASCKAGAPLMKEFITTAERLSRSGTCGDFKNEFDTVIQGIDKLQRVTSKSSIDLRNIESIFAAFEMAKTIMRLADYSKDQIDEINRSIKVLIQKTIEFSMKFPVKSFTAHAPTPYGEFAQLINQMVDQVPQESVSIITFNYDIGIDFALYEANIPFSYFHENGKSGNGIPLLKLHGSFNWLKCDKCQRIYPVKLPDYFHGPTCHVSRDIKNVILELNLKKSNPQDCVSCGGKIPRDSVIVPPTVNKLQYYTLLSPVWQQAAKELGEARNIFVSGYSLPESDEFFKYFLGLGLHSDTRVDKFWVFDPADDPEGVQKRFRVALGPAVTPVYKFFPQTFENAIITIGNEFGFPRQATTRMAVSRQSNG